MIKIDAHKIEHQLTQCLRIKKTNLKKLNLQDPRIKSI